MKAGHSACVVYDLRLPRLRLTAFVACVLVCGLVAVAFNSGPAPAGAEDRRTSAVSIGASVTATSAWKLINSIGLNIHTSYNDTGYASATTVTKLVTELGVRHVRDGVQPNRPDQVAALRKLGVTGVSLDMIMGGPTRVGVQTLNSSQLSELDSLAPYLDSVEAPNEYDCSGDSNWASTLHDYVRLLSTGLASDPSLASIPVLGPSFCRSDSTLTYGSAADSTTVSNSHDYSGGAAPEMALEGRIPLLQAAQRPDMPTEITETGYQNALNATFGQPSVTEQTAADYDLRLLLDAERIGVARTYLYELLDEKPDEGLTDPEEHFGLVRANGTPKPAYTAIQNLLGDVSGGNPNAVTASSGSSTFPVKVQGGGSLLRSLVIGDSDGQGESVALWTAAPQENTSTHAALSTFTRTIRLQLPGTYSASMRQPSNGNQPTSLGTGASVDVPVNGTVTLVHLTSAVAPAVTTTTNCAASDGYGDQATAFGAVASNDLSPDANWSGTPLSDSSAPDDVGTGSAITASGQTLHVPISPARSSWTIALWERTDAPSASFATFAHVTGARGAQLRTYDLTSDAPSHEQISAYGLPVGSNSYGTETFGQAIVGTWHLVALSNNDSTAALSVDGVPEGAVASTSQPLSGLDIGALSNGYRGAVAGLEVFPRVLSFNELTTLATAAPQACSVAGTPSPAESTTTTSTSTAPTSVPAPLTPPTALTVTNTSESGVTSPSGSTASSPSTMPTGTTTSATTSSAPTQTPPSSKTASVTPIPQPTLTRRPSSTRGHAWIRISAPSKVRANAISVFSARLLSAGAAVKNAQVNIFARYSLQGPLVHLKTLRTSRRGNAFVRMRVSASSYWYWTFNGNAHILPATSRTKHVIVVP